MSKKKRTQQRLLFEEALEVLNSQPGKTWNYKQLAAALDVKDKEEREQLNIILEDFARKGLVEEVERGKFQVKSTSKIFEGVVDMTQSGTAYVSSPDISEDIFVPARFINGALHGDLVRVKVFKRKRGDGRDEGEVIEILRRGRTEFAGTLHIQPRAAFFVADNKKFPDFLIPKDAIGKAKDGQKVVVKMTEWEDYSDLPTGEVVAVLGNVGENETEINAIMVEYGLPYQFPKDIERVAHLIPTEITEEEISRRRDFRNVTTFTIDPFDAKDFDDALSVKRLSNGNLEVGVHIADVSHYVKPGSALDKEALTRATSVYLVDRVVPMLPEVLSNYVCSLRPNEDKLCFSAVFELDEQANIKHEWFGRTIINSDRRFTYEEVQEILEGKDGDFMEELHLLDGLAKKMRAERMRKGALSFERDVFQSDEGFEPAYRRFYAAGE
jgi:ribonuclease R